MNRLNQEGSYKLAQLLCVKLALDLDADDLSSLPKVAEMLMDLPEEDVLWGIRYQMGIERCVKHNLDDDNSPFRKVLDRLNKLKETNPDYIKVKDPHITFNEDPDITFK